MKKLPIFYISLFVLSFFFLVCIVKSCNRSTERISAGVVENISEQAKTTALEKRVIMLEQRIDSLEHNISTIDEKRHENFANNPNLSVREHYGDLSKRYANDSRKK